MEGALEWFELSESAINIGVEYSKLLIFNYYLDGIFQVCPFRRLIGDMPKAFLA